MAFLYIRKVLGKKKKISQARLQTYVRFDIMYVVENKGGLVYGKDNKGLCI